MKCVLFIHIPRTAGTSITEWAKQHVSSYQNLAYTIRKPVCNPLSFWTNAEHVSVDWLISRETFTQEWFDSCFKVAFVRNPWDRLVSLWSHLKGYRLGQRRQRESNAYLNDFPTFVEALVEKDFVYLPNKHCTQDWSQAASQLEWLKWGSRLCRPLRAT